jgi:hypothetical protein
MRSYSLLHGGLATAMLLASAHLGASDVQLGGQASFGRNNGGLNTLANSPTGWSLGAFSQLDLGQGQALRGRLDYARSEGWDRKTYMPGKATVLKQSVFDQWSLGADYLHHFSGRTDEGFYLMGGVGIATNRWTNEWHIADEPLTYEAKGRLARRRPASYFQAGLGWQFDRNFGLELRHQISSLGTGDTTVVTPTAAGTVPMAYGRANLGTTYLTATVRF